MTLSIYRSRRRERNLSFNMAEATAADGQMKDLKISEVKKNKKDGAPKTAAKKPQQQKKKVGSVEQSLRTRDGVIHISTD